ncbi:HAD hydrolase-like protein [Streptomyces sp. MB09-02B]|uniref:HAD hydrolase-like protein n=1 Tax=Streptomyces sp. MB09-02B TaxID=3028667 RepID=UPI0039AF1317
MLVHPNLGFFHAAADTVGMPLPDAWGIGDSPYADNSGAIALGLRTVRVSKGQP